MANSDNTHGVFNKLSKDYKLVRIDRASGNLIEPNEILAQSFGGNIETAKDYFLTSDAKACFEAHGTQVQYAITADGNGLAWTIAFGTKGAGTAEGDDHADLAQQSGAFAIHPDPVRHARQHVDARRDRQPEAAIARQFDRRDQDQDEGGVLDEIELGAHPPRERSARIVAVNGLGREA